MVAELADVDSLGVLDADISWKKDHGRAVAVIVNELVSNSLDEGYDASMKEALQANRSSLLLAAEKHDVGLDNLGPDVSQGRIRAIVNKEGALAIDERDIMDKHPLAGAEMVLPQNALAAAMIVMHHRFQKRPYPDLNDERVKKIFSRLTPGQIFLAVEGAKLISLADASRALMEDRPYSQGIPASAAERRLKDDDIWLPHQVHTAIAMCERTLLPRRVLHSA